ncbi:MAG: tetratricopeptide repeat protein [Bacteroidota bacterium]
MKHLLTLFFFLALSGAAWAALGGKSFKDGKELYEQGNYQEAMAHFENAIRENPEAYQGKGNYMIALCYKKLDACSQAKSYFKRAIEADPAKGGASSLDKFNEQIEYCRFTIADLHNASDVPATTTPAQETRPTVLPTPSVEKQPSSRVPMMAGIAALVLLLGAGGYFGYKKMLQNKEAAADTRSYASDQLYNISEILFNDALWLDYAKKYGENNVQRIQNSWQLEYAQLTENKDEVGINQLLRKIRQLESSPASVFQGLTS